MFHTGFIVADQGKKIYIQNISLRKDSIFVSGVHKNLAMDYRCYQASHEAVFSGKQKNFTLRIPCQNQKNYSYVDLEEFIFDCSALMKYPSYESGYLLIRTGDEINYAEVNHLVKLLLKEILKEM